MFERYNIYESTEIVRNPEADRLELKRLKAIYGNGAETGATTLGNIAFNYFVGIGILGASGASESLNGVMAGTDPSAFANTLYATTYTVQTADKAEPALKPKH